MYIYFSVIALICRLIYRQCDWHVSQNGFALDKRRFFFRCDWRGNTVWIFMLLL